MKNFAKTFATIFVSCAILFGGASAMAAPKAHSKYFLRLIA